ncbi:CRASP family complement regulator-acquiring lipoprotein [Borrelia persica]|uniref:CRASP family complement regulator-acquiring lipoprotein n=1 Tax=Borrelia persica TaxID=44448 RepID=UPI000465EA88|nr:CRASP family complement regulator-acquiring lipoprotein [Borrelia persica]
MKIKNFILMLLLLASCNFKKQSFAPTPIKVHSSGVIERGNKITVKSSLIKDLKNIATSDKINRVFKAHDASEPDNQGGMSQVFSVMLYSVTYEGMSRFDYDYKNNERDRRLIYLAFDYDSNHLKLFSIILNKLLSGFGKPYNALDIATYALFRLAVFSRKYYLSSFKTLREKKDNLVNLEIEDLEKLKRYFELLNEDGKVKLEEIQDEIREDYVNDVGRIRTGGDDAQLVYSYLTDITRNYQIRADNVLRKIGDADTNIIKILNKI